MMKKTYLILAMMILTLCTLCLNAAAAEDCEYSLDFSTGETEAAFDHDITMGTVDIDATSCNISVDGEEIMIDVGDYEIIDDISIEAEDAIAVASENDITEPYYSCTFSIKIYEGSDYEEFYLNDTYSYSGNEIRLKGIDYSSNSCDFQVNEENITASKGEIIEIDGIVLIVHYLRFDVCELELYTHYYQSQQTLDKNNNEAILDGKPVSLSGVSEDETECGLKIDGSTIYYEVGGEHVLNLNKVTPIVATYTDQVIYHAHDNDYCELTVRTCECDDNLDCEEEFICEDDDPANDIYIKGELNSEDKTWFDHCVIIEAGEVTENPVECSGTECYLKQYTCEEDFVDDKLVGCDNGCYAGTCLEEAPSPSPTATKTPIQSTTPLSSPNETPTPSPSPSHDPETEEGTTEDDNESDSRDGGQHDEQNSMKQEWLEAKSETSEKKDEYINAKIELAMNNSDQNSQKVIYAGKEMLESSLDEVEAWLRWKKADVDDNSELPDELKETISDDIEENLAKLDSLRLEIDDVDNRLDLGILSLRMVGKWLELVTDVARNSGRMEVFLANRRIEEIKGFESRMRESAKGLSNEDSINNKLNDAMEELVEAESNVEKASQSYEEVNIGSTPMINFANGNSYLRAAKTNMLGAHNDLVEAYRLMLSRGE